MRCKSIIFIVLVLLCMQAVPLDNRDGDGSGQSFSLEQGGKDVKIKALLTKTNILATLSTKLNNKGTPPGFIHFMLHKTPLSLPHFFYVEPEFICVVIIQLFPKIFQSNYLSQN